MAAGRPRIVILCGRAPRHLYVANRLARDCEPLAIVHETGSNVTWRKLLRLVRPAYLINKISRRLRDRKRSHGRSEARFFFDGELPALRRADLIFEAPHVNHESVLALVDRLQPDAIAVFGTSLIRPPLLGRGRFGMLNLHGGLSPEYRGADCAFWALYNGEPEKVGCTLHFIDAGIDTGKLIAHICPEVREGDGDLTLFWRSVRDSAEVYASALARICDGETLGVAQTGKGRLYQVRQRLPRHERELDAKLGAGMLRDIRLPPRVKWFDHGTEANAGMDMHVGTTSDPAYKASGQALLAR